MEIGLLLIGFIWTIGSLMGIAKSVDRIEAMLKEMADKPPFS